MKNKRATETSQLEITFSTSTAIYFKYKSVKTMKV